MLPRHDLAERLWGGGIDDRSEYNLALAAGEPLVRRARFSEASFFMAGDLGAPDERLLILEQIRDCWHDALRAFGGTVEVGPFLCTFDACTDLSWVNYATPTRAARSAEMLAAFPTLREMFAERSRIIRFEFFEALEPMLPRVLEANGLARQMRMPAMVCTRDELRSTTREGDSLSIDHLDGDSDDALLVDFIQTRDAGFGPMSPESMERQIAELRRELRVGAVRPALARVDRRPAGVGTLMGRGPVAELGGVTTIEALRGRGVARRVSQSLVALHLSDLSARAVWLTAGSDLAQRVYDHIGFRVLGYQSIYVDRAWLDRPSPTR